MGDKIFSVAILGCGNRGCDIYGKIINNNKDRFKIVALCDVLKNRVNRFAKVFNVEDKNCFYDEFSFFKEKHADLLIVATQDSDHVRHTIKGLELGYDILVEKPISKDLNECLTLLEVQKRTKRKVMVCHVLRYAAAFTKTKELLDNKVIGDLIDIQAIEQVHYWHYAHSYVRGNWRRGDETSPMILAKCCHDLDLIQYYANSKCKSVSSFGNLSYFIKEKAPIGAKARCLDCPYVDECCYSAKRIYLELWEKYGCPSNCWPVGVITETRPLTRKVILKAIEEGPYGRCVFYSDNNVVDHQIVQMEFENGVKAHLTMMGPTGTGGRIYKFFGTIGQIDLDEENGVIVVKRFGDENETIKINDLLIDNNSGHGGGDNGLINSLYNMLISDEIPTTSLEESIESHLMGIYAEKSRLNNGVLLEIHKK